MKRVLIMCAALFLALTAFAGCATKSQDKSGSTAATSTNSNPGATPGVRQGRPDLTGEVSAVNGNKITLKVIEMQPFGGGPGNGRRSGNASQGNQQGSQQDDRRRRPSGTPRPIQYTGETKEITVPDGMKITTMGRNQNGGAAVELKDLKAGDRLMVWYSDKDKGIVSRISMFGNGEQNPGNGG